MASIIFDSFWDDLQKGNIDLDTDTFKAMLTTASYAESKGSHLKRSDITDEVTGTGYTAGGSAVTFTLTPDLVNNQQNAAYSDQAFATSTITARKQVVYKSRGGAASADELVCVNDFGSDVISSGGTLTIKGSTIRVQN
ncbi:MAG: hypothetical protein ACRENK_15575 [Gemmatimonadaceae bacterium]